VDGADTPAEVASATMEDVAAVMAAPEPTAPV